MSDRSEQQFETLIQAFTAKMTKVKCSIEEYLVGLEMAIQELRVMQDAAEQDLKAGKE